jgi:hypothetical protein
MRKSISFLRHCMMLAASACGGAAWGGFTHQGAVIQGYFSYYPGLTTDPSAVGWIDLAQIGTDFGSGPPSYSLSLPQTSWTDSGVTFTGSGQASYSTTTPFAESDASFKLSVDGSSTVTAYADLFDDHNFNIFREAPKGIRDYIDYYHTASYKIDGYASPGDTVTLFAIVWCDAAPTEDSNFYGHFLSPTASTPQQFDFTAPLATIVGTGDFHYESSVVGEFFNLGKGDGCNDLSCVWTQGEHLIHIGALIQHDGSSGSSWVNFDPTTGTPFQAHAPLAGDYNGNGIVDAADYTVWRDHLGQNYALQNRDPSASGPIGTSDYAYWVAHFGQSGSGAGSAGASPSPVPEPATLWLAIFALLGCGVFVIERRAQSLCLT